MLILRVPLKVCLVVASVTASLSVSAAEVTTYTYDALGRLAVASSAGTVNSGIQVAVEFDKAGNRAELEVSGSGRAPVRQAVVVPLNGYTVIVILED